METAQAGENCFLEAHYYSGGLRHHPVGLAAQRPDWAPPADAVGFRDEFPLAPGDLIIEFQRRQYRDQLITWVGVYARSVDEKLGERENHAGLGLWLLEASIVDARSVLDALKLMAEKFSSAFDAQGFANEARRFLAKFLPHYIQPARAFLPGFPGAAFTTTELLRNSFYQVVGPVVPANLHLAADQLSLLMFSPGLSSTMRALIILSNLEKRPVTSGEVQLIKPDMDPVKHLVSMIPQAVAAENDTLRKLELERDQLVLKLQESNTRVRALQEERDRISSDLDVASAEIEDLRKNQPRRPGGPVAAPDYSSIASKLNDMDRKLSRLISESSPIDARDAQQEGTIYLGWELILIVTLALVVLALLGWGGVAAYNTFIAHPAA